MVQLVVGKHILLAPFVKHRDGNQPNPIQVPSRVAALNMRGRTLHSASDLPLHGFASMSGSRLANMQLDWEGVHFIFIDETSASGQRTLATIDSCDGSTLYRLSSESFRLQVVHRQAETH